MKILRPLVKRFAGRIINRALRTPDDHLDGYMLRFWLFNPYNRETRRPRYPWIPLSIRVHKILRADNARHPHDHPWNARTIILDGWYLEQRDNESFLRMTGDTAKIGFGEYHHIAAVSPGGVWTLFIMGRYRGTWGFRVDGRKINYREYLGE
ncbi:MAG: hypothetical protein ACTHKB_11515 [Burkholderiaceae bacterium]